jgi:hypothetical protein
VCHIAEGFACLTDRDLARAIPTVFEPSGVAVLTLPLGNLEHLTNHKHQVFLYLEMLGVPVGTPDLHYWRHSRRSRLACQPPDVRFMASGAPRMA